MALSMWLQKLKTVYLQESKMKSFKEYLNEEENILTQHLPKSGKITNKTIVNYLRSPDFGMTEQGGNGEAVLVKGKIVVKDSCYIGCREREASMIKSWKPGGTNHTFFINQAGVKLKILSTDFQFTGGKMYGRKQNNGIISITMTV